MGFVTDVDEGSLPVVGSDWVRHQRRLPHPLEPLSDDEVRDTAAAVRAYPEYAEDSVFVYIWLREPPKAALAEYELADRVPARESKVVLYDRSLRLVTEVVVSLADRKVRSWRPVPGVRPKASRRDFLAAVQAVKADPRWQAALRSRGVSDFTHVEVQPWPPGYPEERDAAHRGPGGQGPDLGRVLGNRQHVRPAGREPGRHRRPGHLDRACCRRSRGGAAAAPAGNYAPELASDAGNFPVLTALRPDLRPIEITQPEGPSFTLDGHEIRWQKWHLVIGYSPREGLVLHQVRYADGGRERPVLDRASLSEMWVPYGDPAPVHRVKAVFDAGEAGIGSLANSLELGCDCLGEISYLDAVVNDDDGEPVRLPNAICIHEEDTGIGWKHTQYLSGSVEVRRGRRLVISIVLDRRQLRLRLLLVPPHRRHDRLRGQAHRHHLDRRRSPTAREPAYGTVVAPGLYGPHHQHFFNVRLDMAVDGDANSVFEVDAVPAPPGPGNPAGNAWVARERPLETEAEAQRLASAPAGRDLAGGERVGRATPTGGRSATSWCPGPARCRRSSRTPPRWRAPSSPPSTCG